MVSPSVLGPWVTPLRLPPGREDAAAWAACGQLQLWPAWPHTRSALGCCAQTRPFTSWSLRSSQLSAQLVTPASEGFCEE